MTKELFQVLTPTDALRRLHDHLSVNVRAQRVPLNQALGRILARDLTSAADLPDFARSTMDGFAVQAADTYGASEGLPAYLTLVGEIAMGTQADVTVGPTQTARIATGGMLPPGADAVVMVELTQEVDATTIEVLRPVASGENVIRAGEDIAVGDAVLPMGHELRAQDLGGLAALGIIEVDVATRLRVGIISSGDEIVAPDEQPKPGQIRDVNTSALAGLVAQAGHEPVRLGLVPDDEQQLTALAREGIESCDMLILSAGSSVSARDMTAEVIQSLGEPGVLVHGVSLRPGKPTILAVAQGKPVFGLPGNPVSCMVTFDLFVTPTLALLTGARRPPRRTTMARLSHSIASAAGREDYVQVRLEERDGEQCAAPVFGKSGLIYTMVHADGMVKIELDDGGLPAGTMVPVILF